MDPGRSRPCNPASKAVCWKIPSSSGEVSVLFYSDLWLIGWGPPALRRVICFTQSPLMLISSKSTVTETSWVMFGHISGRSLGISCLDSVKMKFNLIWLVQSALMSSYNRTLISQAFGLKKLFVLWGNIFSALQRIPALQSQVWLHLVPGAWSRPSFMSPDLEGIVIILCTVSKNTHYAFVRISEIINIINFSVLCLIQNKGLISVEVSSNSQKILKPIPTKLDI